MTILKYAGHSVIFQEVPNEITLAFNITGFPHRCPGCHTPELRDDTGRRLLLDLGPLLKWYRNSISCVCFMGGEHNVPEMKIALQMVKDAGMKTCLYSGCDCAEEFADLLPLLDYLKLGHYDEALGGLNNPNTNQSMFAFDEDGVATDITHMFWRKKT